jgi:hypothetical protein
LTDRLILALLVCAPLAAGAGDGPNPDQEPPQIFYLEVDGKKVPIELDKPFPTESLKGSKSVILRVEPFRVFRYGGLTFQYPREYNFEADHSTPGLGLWTLSGNDCVIMVQRFEGNADPEEMRRLVVDQLAAKYEGAKKKQGETTLKLKDTILKGIRLEVEFAESTFHQDSYALPAGKNDSVVLMIQDSVQDDGKPSADRVRAEKLLSETLRLPVR